MVAACAASPTGRAIPKDKDGRDQIDQIAGRQLLSLLRAVSQQRSEQQEQQEQAHR